MKETIKRKSFSAFVTWVYTNILLGLTSVYESEMMFYWFTGSIISPLFILGIGVPVSLLSDWITRNNSPFRPLIAFMIHAGSILATDIYIGAGFRDVISVAVFFYTSIATVFWAADEYYRKKISGAQ